MGDIVIRVENLTKEYRLGTISHGTLKEDLQSWWARLWGKEDPNSIVSHPSAPRYSQPDQNPRFLALDDVSFDVTQGEAIGIIGRNGAGKSTLLKILSRVTAPTSGVVKIRGRVASLLEVGTGFHPELTGRENIFLNGTILGMKRPEIVRKFDEIVAFAEIDQFIDTPVKRYSSGMYVRLAFAVAAHLEPEILIVDEVLAVGDASFQKKCLGKMGEVGKQGRTVLFVSHNMGAVVRLCQTSIWLDAGKIMGVGESTEVVQHYQSQNVRACASWTRPAQMESNNSLIFESIEIKKNNGPVAAVFEADEPVLVAITYLVKTDLVGCQIGVRVYNSEGVVVFSTADSDDTDVSALPKDKGEYLTRFTIPADYLMPGSYYLSVSAHLPHRTLYETVEQPVTFNISTAGWIGAYDGRLGVVSPKIIWEVYRQ